MYGDNQPNEIGDTTRSEKQTVTGRFMFSFSRQSLADCLIRIISRHSIASELMNSVQAKQQVELSIVSAPIAQIHSSRSVSAQVRRKTYCQCQLIPLEVRVAFS